MSTHAPAHTPLATAHRSLVTTHPGTHATTVVPKLNTSFENTKLHLKAATASHHSSGSGGSILRTVVALVIVIAVIYGLTWIVKRLKAKDRGPASGDGLERIAQLPLGTNKSVALVRVGTELHLLGLAEHSVTGIRTFTEDEALELGLPVTPPGSGFGPRRREDDMERAFSAPRTSTMAGTGTGLGGTLETLRKLTQR